MAVPSRSAAPLPHPEPGSYCIWLITCEVEVAGEDCGPFAGETRDGNHHRVCLIEFEEAEHR
jgi:hypothetical protein